MLEAMERAQERRPREDAAALHVCAVEHQPKPERLAAGIVAFLRKREEFKLRMAAAERKPVSGDL